MTTVPRDDEPVQHAPSQRSFTVPEQELIGFDVGGESFDALRHPPAEALFSILRVITTPNGELKAHVFGDFLDLVLTDESAQRFAARLSSKANPITAEVAGDVVKWLAEDIYKAMRFAKPSDRPTTPSSPGAPSGSPGGEGSTAGVRPAASIPLG